MPADILRERETDTPDTDKTLMATERPGFSDLAQAAPDLQTRMAQTDREMQEARRLREEARAAERTALETQAAAVKPQISSVEQAMQQREELAQHRPPPVVLPQPPTRQLTDFLAPVAGETPENTISKMLQGIGLLATGFTGLARGNATSALSSLGGALKGWHEGDKERADRSFSDWQAQTDKLITENRSLHKSYQEIMDDADTNIGQKLELLRLKGIAVGHDAAVKTFERQNADEDIKEIEKLRMHLDGLEKDRRHLVQAKLISDERLATQLEIQNRNFDIKDREFERRARQDRESPLSDADMDKLAIIEFNGGRTPSFGMGRSADRARYLVAKSRMVDELGGPEAVGQRQASLSGLRAELAQVMKNRGVVEAFSQTAAKNLRDAEALSAQVDRGGSPMFNKWALAGRKAWAGDPAVAEFDTAVRTAINEVARVLNSANASGVISDTARKEIEEMLNTAMTAEQFKRVVSRLHKEMENRRSSYADQVKVIEDEIRRTAKREPTVAAPLAPPPMGSADDPLGVLAKTKK